MSLQLGSARILFCFEPFIEMHVCSWEEVESTCFNVTPSKKEMLTQNICKSKLKAVFTMCEKCLN